MQGFRLTGWREHPIRVVQVLLRHLPADTLLEFSIYQYRPQTVADERNVFFLTRADLSTTWLEDCVLRLPAGAELAMHSRVRIGGSFMHIPMLDLAGSRLEQCRARLSEVMPPPLYAGSAFYRSGRSFHVYSSVLLYPDDWARYMGLALLANLPGREPVVDSRWIGHRLIAGYGSLRWSANSSRHPALPTLVRRPLSA